MSIDPAGEEELVSEHQQDSLSRQPFMIDRSIIRNLTNIPVLSEDCERYSAKIAEIEACHGQKCDKNPLVKWFTRTESL